MATRLSKNTIPSSYIRLDDHVTAADSFINARDLQVARNNQNKLIARSTKRQLLNTFNTGYFVYSCRSGNRTNGDVMFSVPLMLSATTREINVVMGAYKILSDVTLKLVVDMTGQQGEYDVTTQSVTVTTTATNPATKYTATLPVPGVIREGVICMLTCYIQGYSSGGNNLGGAKSISGFGDQWVDIVTTGSAPGLRDTLYFTNGGEGIGWKVIDKVVNQGSNTYRCYLDEPLEAPINITVDTVGTKDTIACGITALSVYEKGVSNFDSNLDLY